MVAATLHLQRLLLSAGVLGGGGNRLGRGISDHSLREGEEVGTEEKGPRMNEGGAGGEAGPSPPKRTYSSSPYEFFFKLFLSQFSLFFQFGMPSCICRPIHHRNFVDSIRESAEKQALSSAADAAKLRRFFTSLAALSSRLWSTLNAQLVHQIAQRGQR